MVFILTPAGTTTISRLEIKSSTGFEITTEIVHDSHDYHDKNFVVHDFLVGQTIFDEIFDVKL